MPPMPDNAARDLFPGALEMMVLRLLKQEPMHGYALVQRIQQASRNLLQVEEGSLYPALQRLLKDGLVSAEWGVSSTKRRVRIYSLTRAGAKHLANEMSSFERMFRGHQSHPRPGGCDEPPRPTLPSTTGLREPGRRDSLAPGRDGSTISSRKECRAPTRRAAARRAFGNVTNLVEQGRETWEWPSVESFAMDVRYALRQLRRMPALSATIVLTWP